MLKKIKVSLSLFQIVLVLLVIGLVWLTSLPAASAQALPDIDFGDKGLEISVDSNKSVDPQIKGASDKLSDNLRQSTDRITDKVEGMVEKAADKAERQFRRNLRGAERPAEDLDEVIERTIFKDVGNALEAK